MHAATITSVIVARARTGPICGTDDYHHGYGGRVLPCMSYIGEDDGEGQQQ